MKRHFLLFFFITFISLLDWSCYHSCEHYETADLYVEGIDEVHVQTIDTNLNLLNYIQGDTVSYRNISFSLTRKLVLALESSFSGFGTAAYADDCDVGPQFVRWDLDSILIWEETSQGRKRVESDFALMQPQYYYYSTDLRDSLFITNEADDLDDFEEQTSYQSNPLLILINPPKETTTASYEFQFYSKDGRVFKGKSGPVIIKD